MFEKRAQLTLKAEEIEVLSNPDFSSGNHDFLKSLDLKIAAKEADFKKDTDSPEFDLEAEVREHPDSLYIKCFAIKANETNDNGDWFSTEELKKAYQTFIGVPCFTNHQNDDVEKAKGKVIHAWYDDDKDGIMIISRIDAVAYPHLARGIKESYISSTSMGTQVQYSLCSICHNYAAKPTEYCSHIKEMKGKVLSGKTKCIYNKNGSGECPLCGSDKNHQKTIEYKVDAHEKNYELKFIENSFVVNPACSDCGITDVIDTSKFLAKVATLRETLPGLLKVASQQPLVCSDQSCMNLINQDDVQVFETALKQIDLFVNDVKEVDRLQMLKTSADKTSERMADLAKFAGEKELNDLKQALQLISDVSKKMIDQKESIDLEYLEDLVKTMTLLQETTGELDQMGYGRLPEPGTQPDMEGQAQPGAEMQPGMTPTGAPPGVGGSKIETGQTPSGIGTVTGPMAGLNIKFPKMGKRKRINPASTFKVASRQKISLGQRGLRMLPKEKKQLNQIISDLSKDYHEQIPLQTIAAALRSAGYLLVQEDGTSWSGLFLGKEGRANIEIAPLDSVRDGIYSPVINTSLAIYWHQMEQSGLYEITAYLG